MKTICVYCASSDKAPEQYKDSAHELGKILVKHGYRVVYGGGSIGLMGALADSVLEAEGKITGIIPDFMTELEWGHKGVELISVTSMHERKKLMLEMSDAVIALAGGCGTFEEILEAITWRRLGLFKGPAIICNTNNYYDPIIRQLEMSIEQNFMNAEHRELWSVIDNPDEIIAILENHKNLENPLNNAAVK
jgi:uncharacterized protein (TIGR00730 family)